jgi:hypothetical protein
MPPRVDLFGESSWTATAEEQQSARNVQDVTIASAHLEGALK